MIKGISAINTLKTGAAALLLAGAGALYASNPVKNVNKETQPNQTEVVSKAGADALKSNIVQIVDQEVPTVHNPKIDKMFRKYATNEEDTNKINSLLNRFYDQKGTFWASALFQHEIDRLQLYILLEEKGDLLIKNDINPSLGEEIKQYGADFYKSVRPHAKEVSEWLDNSYTPALVSLLSFDHKPTAKEVSERIDEIAGKKSGFSNDDAIDYYVASDYYKNKYLKDKTDDLSMSELIAYKIFTLDEIMFKKSTTNCNFFDHNIRIDKYIGFIRHFE